eukprot:jgi/Botrbrau1/21294/Bobra.0184s0007.1
MYTTKRNEASSPEVVAEACGKNLYLCEDSYIRFTHHHPVNDNQEFCYNLLLVKIPFRSPEDLISASNPSKCYLQECKILGIIADENVLLVIMTAYVEQRLLPPASALDLFQCFLAEHPLDSTQPENMTATSVADRAQQHIIHMAQTFQALTSANTGKTSNNCRNKHRPKRTIHHRRRRRIWKDSCGTALPDTFVANPSTSVQVLTKALMDQNAVVLQCASTGAAAMRLSPYARTAHSLVRIPVTRSQRYYSTRNKEYHLLRRANAIIIDDLLNVPQSFRPGKQLLRDYTRNQNNDFHFTGAEFAP